MVSINDINAAFWVIEGGIAVEYEKSLPWFSDLLPSKPKRLNSNSCPDWNQLSVDNDKMCVSKKRGGLHAVIIDVNNARFNTSMLLVF